MATLKIFEDFSEYPGLRNCNISEDSGEHFYHKLLNKSFKEALENKEILTVDLDNVDGFAPSFLDESFGNLVYDFSLEIVEKHINIKSDIVPQYKKLILEETYSQWEERRNKNIEPKVTEEHSPWFRLVDNKIESKVWRRP